MKYKDWLSDWLEHYIKPTAKIRTERYRGLSLHIVKKIGEIEFRDLSPIILRRLKLNEKNK